MPTLSLLKIYFYQQNFYKLLKYVTKITINEFLSKSVITKKV